MSRDTIGRSAAIVVAIALVAVGMVGGGAAYLVAVLAAVAAAVAGFQAGRLLSEGERKTTTT